MSVMYRRKGTAENTDTHTVSVLSLRSIPERFVCFFHVGFSSAAEVVQSLVIQELPRCSHRLSRPVRYVTIMGSPS